MDVAWMLKQRRVRSGKLALQFCDGLPLFSLPSQVTPRPFYSKLWESSFQRIYNTKIILNNFTFIIHFYFYYTFLYIFIQEYNE